ncbi:EF-hand domain-containing protein [Saccharothrix sp. Mg75]|uniref:EF-hand domain-containing protein n=1 Tax=Saccharothrix sp. Mg75 TaxID=3445357 RepID=UPI003EEB5246
MSHDITERKFTILFDWFDHTDDGRLTHPDFEHLVLGIVNALVRALDSDGSGSISHAEFRTAIEEFYLGTDPEAPGNRLPGSPLTTG